MVSASTAEHQQTVPRPSGENTKSRYFRGMTYNANQNQTRTISHAPLRAVNEEGVTLVTFSCPQHLGATATLA